MTKKNEVVKTQEKNSFSPEEYRVIRTLFDPSNKLSDEQVTIFLSVSKDRGLDPRLKQICAVPKVNGKTGKTELVMITMIDGFRLIAERTQRYSPGKPTVFEYDKNGNLLSATAFVKKMTADGTWHEISATAFLREYAASFGLWSKMPHVMLEKCAEARALRRAFPGDLSGLYSQEEMHQADVEIADSTPLETRQEIDVEVDEVPFKLSEKQLKELNYYLGQVPSLRNMVDRFLQKQGIESIDYMPFESYTHILEIGKRQIEEMKAEVEDETGF